MIESLTSGAAGFLMTAFAFLFVLTIVVFFHELGHFLVARWCGVTVKAFSIGFGPELLAFDDRHGTRWRIALFPLGGYVKFMDDENAASAPSREALEKMSPEQRAGAFHAKPVWQRAAVVVAGPIANFLLAIVIFAAWFLIFGVNSTEPRIDDVLADSPAARAGFKAGDVVVSIDGEEIKGFEDVQQVVSTRVGRPLVVFVKRAEELVQLQVTPEVRQQVDEHGEKMSSVVIGIRRTLTPSAVNNYKPGPLEAIWLGAKQTKLIITSTLGYLGDVVFGRQSADQLGGPVRIADIAGKVAQKSAIDVIYLAGFISVSVGLINLFPIPLLDGGHLLFYAVEAVRRRPLSERTQEIGFRIGLAVVLSLMLFATFNDLPILKRWIVGAG